MDEACFQQVKVGDLAASKWWAKRGALTPRQEDLGALLT